LIRVLIDESSVVYLYVWIDPLSGSRHDRQKNRVKDKDESLPITFWESTYKDILGVKRVHGIDYILYMYVSVYHRWM